jgi:hypothetical protein
MPYSDPDERKRYSKERHSRLQKAGLCVICCSPAITGNLCEEHKKKQLEGQKKRNKERMEGKICVMCGKNPSVTSQHCEECREKFNKSRLAFRNSQIELVKDHYGHACACCGENEPTFLSLDHMNDDGSKERKGGKSDMYVIIARIYKKTGVWPDGLQILCYNCNSGRYRNGGICPHKSSNFSSSGGMNR